jgi:RNA polymerase sigma-70 factor (ECF subfamily)
VSVDFGQGVGGGAAPGAISATRTTTRLLDALREPGNEPAWLAIDSRYRPVLVGLAHRMGLSGEAAEEVAQQALSEFVRDYRAGRYDRSKGRLSSWIIAIAQHASLRALRARRRQAGRDDHAGLDELPDPRLVRQWWEQERDRAILARALNTLRESSAIDDRTFLAFELSGLRGVPAEEAARQGGMSVEQVYVARSRLTRRLRELVQEETAAFEEDG